MRKAVLALSLLALCGRSEGADDVVWTGAVGVSINGNSLTKTTGQDQVWDSGAASLNLVKAGYGFVEFKAVETTTWRILGLHHGAATTDYLQINYGVLLGPAGRFFAYENGQPKYDSGATTYSSNDIFRVEVYHGVVRYRRNGTIFYPTQPSYFQTPPTYPLRVDTSLYSLGATLQNVRVGTVALANEVGAVISEDGLAKTGAAGWNAGAVSANSIDEGDGFFEFTATGSAANRLAGLTSQTWGPNTTHVGFGVHLMADGTAEILEGGTSVQPTGSYSTGDRFRVELQGGVVRYYENGTLLYTSTATPSYPLRADVVLDTPGGTLGSVSLESLVWTNARNVTLSGNNLTKTSAVGWDGGAASTNQVASGDIYMEFGAIETNTRRVGGLKQGAPGQTDVDIDFGILLREDGSAQAYELGVLQGTSTPYAYGDRFRVEVQEGVVRYRKNGTVFFSSLTAPQYPLHAEAALYTPGAAVIDLMSGDTVWMNLVGVLAWGNSLIKTAATLGWDAGASSTKAVNEGYVEFTAGATDVARAIGLSHGDASQDWTELNYAIDLSLDGAIYIMENGAYHLAATCQTPPCYASGDRMRVQYQGGTISYLKNGSVMESHATTPHLPLRVDTSLLSPGGSLLNVVLSGAAAVDTVEPPVFTPPAGTYTLTQRVVISSTTSGAAIWYTTDGTDPDESSTLYSDRVLVNQTVTLRAKGFKPNWNASEIRQAVYTTKVPNPQYTPTPGVYPDVLSVQMSLPQDLDAPTAIIRYTTDGSVPTTSSTQYTAPVPVTQNVTLMAKAWRVGWTESDPASGVYMLKVAQPILSLDSGTYSGVQSVTVTDATMGALIRYTTTGLEPTILDSSVASGGTITVDRSMTLKVKGFKPGWTASDTTIRTYFLNQGTVATPTFAPPAGAYAPPLNVVLSSSTPGAVIRYTLDGSEPTGASKRYTPSLGLALSLTTTVKAKAFLGDALSSATATADYDLDQGHVATPRFSPGSGTYPAFRTVTVTCTTPGATIHYTTNGQDPTALDTVIASGGTLTIDHAMMLKAKAFLGADSSGVQRGDYWIAGTISAGDNWSVAVKTDGTVWAWGYNYGGELGNGHLDPPPQYTPGQVLGLTGTVIVSVSGGGDHTLALTNDGHVYAWGGNTSGQLGDNSTMQRTSAVEVHGENGAGFLEGIVAVAAGATHSLALRSDGSVFAWGSAALGNGTSQSLVPVRVPNLMGITAIAAGYQTSFALKTDGSGAGTLWAWGRNDLHPSLGDGTNVNRDTPVEVGGSSAIVAVSTRNYHVLTSRADGSLWSWGFNDDGELGDGTSTTSSIPVRVQGLGATSLAAGSLFSLALNESGGVWAWGLAVSVGDGIGIENERAPGRVLGITDAVQIAAGVYHGLVLKADGSLWSWGLGSYGQIGDGTTQSRLVPVRVGGSFSLSDGTWLTDDPDHDGLPTWLELRLGSDPLNPDTNGDGIPDGTAYAMGISLTDPDMDHDGLDNWTERRIGTDPFNPDTDGDGVLDGADCFPLDKTRWQCPSPTGIAPHIMLVEPTNATIIRIEPPP